MGEGPGAGRGAGGRGWVEERGFGWVRSTRAQAPSCVESFAFRRPLHAFGGTVRVRLRLR